MIAELTIVRAFSLRLGQQNTQKVIYLAPLKALCTERVSDWTTKFEGTGITVLELTGDTTDFTPQSLHKYNIIITTPEKWDSVTRKWRDIQQVIKDLALVIIDEVHLLQESRGATLEAVVSRMKLISQHATMANTGKLVIIELSNKSGASKMRYSGIL